MEKLIFEDIDPALYKALKPLLQDIFNQTKLFRISNIKKINKI